MQSSDDTGINPGNENYVIGVDYGTLSGRAPALLVRRVWRREQHGPGASKLGAANA